jgi:hypothetical protein
MKTVRRLYIYAVAFVSLEIVLWGLIGLLRTTFNAPEFGSAEALAQALALILVGVPIFLIHWFWAQRLSAQDEEEKTASLRAVFFYGLLLATLVPVVQNLLALINRLFLGAARMSVERALFGGYQTWPDNLIAILMNLLVAAYFWNILRNEWKTLPDAENCSDVRRLYRYIWVLYGLLMVVIGAQQVLRFIFFIPSGTLGGLGRETFVNGLALLAVGTPVWVYSWRLVQDSLRDPAESGSTLRLGVLYVLALAGVITVLASGGALLNVLLRRLLGEAMSWPDFVQRIGGPISVGLPLGAIWAYYGHWLDAHIESSAEGPRREGLKRPYFYILSFIGLTTAFVGVGSLISTMIGLATGQETIVGDVFRDQLAGSISSIVIGLPLWLMTWRPMQTQATQAGDSGDHARRSVVRKAYLYLVLFAAVIGGMIVAVGLVFTLINALLTQDLSGGFFTTILNFLQYLLLFGVVLFYHLLALRRDGASSADALAEKQAGFAVLVFEMGDGKFGESMKAALTKQAPKLPVTVLNATQKIPADVKAGAVVLPGSLAVDPPESLAKWLRGFNGSRLIVPDEAAAEGPATSGRVVWTQDSEQAALAARALAEGQEFRPPSSKRTSALTVVAYIFAALFALQLLFGLLLMGIAAVSGFD